MTEDFSFLYDLKTELETVGRTKLKVQSIKDLNRTIDLLFAYLEKTGNASLLEELCPYFGVVWPSARALAEHLDEIIQDGQQSLKNLNILEIGCGLALPSLLLAVKGIPVTATDFHPEVPRFLERNIGLNRVKGLIEFVMLDWKTSSLPKSSYDLIVGSDILYEQQHASQVAKMLAKYARPGTQVIIADPARPYLQGFVDEMKSLGFSYEALLRSVFEDASPEKSKGRLKDKPDGKLKDIFILKFKK